MSKRFHVWSKLFWQFCSIFEAIRFLGSDANSIHRPMWPFIKACCMQTIAASKIVVPPKHSIKKIELIFFKNNNAQNDKILQDSILAQFQYDSKIVLTILYSLFLWTASNLANLNKAKTLVMLKFVIIS